MRRQISAVLLCSVMIFLTSCFGETETTEVPDEVVEAGEVTLYTHRHYDVDKELYQKFTEETGIKVNVQKAKANELMVRLEEEGEQSPADILMTVDVARLVQAKERGLLQTVSSDYLNRTIPANLRDADGQWYGMTIRSRVIVYSKDRVDPSELSTYEDLANEKWKGRLLVRSSGNIYNQSLMASIIAHHGEDSAKTWATGVVANMAQDPKGNDRDQCKFIVAGQGDVTLVNTYYIGKLLNSDNEEERAVGQAVGVFFPNQGDRGAHINISGAAVCKHSPNKENAIKLLEFLASDEVQAVYAAENSEFPVNANVEADSLLKSWGDFKADEIELTKLGANNAKAIEVFDAAGWQ